METQQISKTATWTGRTMSILVILFMLFDLVLKFLRPQIVYDTTAQLGYAEHHIIVQALTGLVPTILYLFPRTSFLGALLLTAHFGGAIATHLRVDSPLFSHILFPVYLGILMWGGLWLREPRLKEILPLRKTN